MWGKTLLNPKTIKTNRFQWRNMRNPHKKARNPGPVTASSMFYAMRSVL